MDQFVSRKRRRLSLDTDDCKDGEQPSRGEAGTLCSTDTDDDSTDFKLAMLSSLHPSVDQQTLLDILLAHEGSLESASNSLILRPEALPTKSNAVPGYQSSLSSFATHTNSTSSPSKRHKPISKKGKTLHLYSPEDISAHTPCSIVHNFLTPKEANELLLELLEEVPSFEKMTFKLFDNVVSSPHTASFYVKDREEQIRQKTEYVYNGDLLTNVLLCFNPNYWQVMGIEEYETMNPIKFSTFHIARLGGRSEHLKIFERSPRDVRQLTPKMKEISAKVQEAVNIEVQARIKSHYPHSRKLQYQSPHLWTPNAAFVNCYAGGQQSVGYHSDQLTYVGPRAIIGSLSLGVAREFRVRRIIPQESSAESGAKTKSREEADAEGQIAIHLPHNSLLVMHAEMQEEWKHSIAPAQAIDPHPIAGNKRINITYRDYKASLHPRFTPKCRCGVPTVLRVVQRKKENHGRYFWQCHAGNVPGKEGCDFFKWAVFDDNGEPIWGK